ncbi:hypothetical protein N781_00590 [Pontibacillus halophilus JSM 076056 = DSM 19796]|uniref:DUF4183 domain-containing protein n=1 Tax=Pontibacillus halophilus JSM 076056 = DSM 19796 TaxID=1385510 RepID=A0A0A5ID18_9BACI|nr:DUF4183 domain-containing protein [Pontibacillus halophilus]KGX93737.1 hypothetical protein N781_00590 [Pontibacillus halophilus JSM 076056 = DSM 19796]
MALELFKPFASATTTTNVTPSNTKFFYTTVAETAAGATLSIDAADFLLDDGNNATTLPALATDNSYFVVYINGVAQMEGIATYTPGATAVGSLDIAVPGGGGSILAGTPIILEVLNYTPASDTTINT